MVCGGSVDCYSKYNQISILAKNKITVLLSWRGEVEMDCLTKNLI